MEVARHERQHSNLQSQRHHEQLPDAKRQRQAACKAMACCFSHPLRGARSNPAVQGAQIDTKLSCARLMRCVPRDISPASQRSHIRLHRLFQPRHSQTRNAANGHKCELKTGIAQGEWFCNSAI